MSRPCPLPSCTRNPRSCTPSSVVNGTADSRQQKRFIALAGCSPLALHDFIDIEDNRHLRPEDAEVHARVRVRARGRGWTRGMYTQKTADSRRRRLEPAASWNATRRPDPLTASQKLLLRVTAPPVPSSPSAYTLAPARSRGSRAPRPLHFSASSSRADTNHFSP